MNIYAKFVLPVLLAALFLGAAAPAPKWGFFAHRQINKMAVFTLPPELIVLYKKHLDYLTEHAIDPDKRRYASPFEAPRHYIDLEAWPDQLPVAWTDALLAKTRLRAIGTRLDTFDFFDGSPRFPDALDGDSVRLAPQLAGRPVRISVARFRDFFVQNIVRAYYHETWEIPADSIARLTGRPIENLNCRLVFGEDGVSPHGILPWHLARMQNQLTRAFKQGDIAQILRLSADFGHYIADAHVPLHTTENYNGQLTGQIGIHAFWETRLPQLFFDQYDLWVGKAQYLPDPVGFFRATIFKSNALKDSVLGIEKDLRHRFPEDRQQCFEEKNGQMVSIQCPEFARAYHDRLNGMVESRFRDAIRAVGSAWLTAWTDAGRPRLLDDGTFAPPPDSAVAGEKIRPIREHWNE
ncbi:MAG: hypothetical protein D6714_21430 [Bacteroidetes bacterium]|nr:MAG: hypothetical protein D6714_21430 [Bacteroidota bacterium]